MTYAEWLESEARKARDREMIEMKHRKGRSPEWIHKEDEYPMDLIMEVQADIGSTGSEMYKSIMEGLLEDLHDIQLYGEPQGRKTVMEKVSIEKTERGAEKVTSYKEYRDTRLTVDPLTSYKF